MVDRCLTGDPATDINSTTTSGLAGSEFRSNQTEPPLQPFSSLDEASQSQVDDKGDTDIFRGQPPPRSTSPVSIVLSSSSSSSDTASLLGGRFTAIAGIVELAISGWARATSALSNSSFDNLSARSSTTVSRHRSTGRRHRRASSASIRTLPSERDLAAKYRAREQSRYIPREFVLYMPLTQHAAGAGTKSQALPQRVSRTSSLPLILDKLEMALKKFTKVRRLHRSRPMSLAVLSPNPASLHQDYMLSDPMLVPRCPASFTDLGTLSITRKGKERQSPRPHQMFSPMPETNEANRAPKAWWLDVSSPTWEDIRAIGKVNIRTELVNSFDDMLFKLLHLHPLTLEDILQQDPREKLELFPRLGYYFVSFRAIESQATRERFRRYNTTAADHNEYQDDGGVIGEANVYLVVFREGVCSVSHIFTGNGYWLMELSVPFHRHRR
jgi:magnesium transporter